MPLITTPLSPTAVLAPLRDRATPDNPSFLIIYASLTDDRSWCSDCRAAEPLLNEKFAGEDKESLIVAYAGVKDEYVLFGCKNLGRLVLILGYRWRKSENVWRKEPFFVEALPTLIKVRADGVSFICIWMK